MMTLDDLASEMRRRFTSSQGIPVEITAEEWAVMAEAIYLRDALVEIVENPESPIAKAMLTKHRRA